MALYAYYPTCAEEDLPDYIPEICPADADPEHGRIRSIAFIHKDFIATLVATPTAVTWKTGITTGKIKIVPTVTGAYDGGSPVTAPGYGDQAEKITGFTNSLTFKDPTFKVNAGFYNALLNSSAFHVAWRTETQTQISDNPVTVIPKNPITDSLTDEVVFDVEAKWSQPTMSVPFDTPIGVFSPAFLLDTV